MQYIGARYVTKIYENSGDPSSAEWEASVNYEPLTMVTYNNGSYLSKKAVPASAGDPPSEPTYWVQTGFYNGQIAYLQSQIDSINVIINKLKVPKNIILVGDSWGTGVGGDHGWVYYLTNLLTEADNVYDASVSGAGFMGYGGVKYLTNLQAIAGNISDPDAIDLVLVAGGVNDEDHVSTDIENAIEAFVDYVDQTYPNAKVLNVALNSRLGYTTTADMREKVYLASYEYEEGYKNKYFYIDGRHQAAFHLYNDNFHMGNAGYMQVAKYLYGLIYDIPYNYSLAFDTAVTFTNTTDFGTSVSFNADLIEDRDAIYVHTGSINIASWTTSNFFTPAEFTCSSDHVFPYNSVFRSGLAMCSFSIDNGAHYQTIPVTYRLTGPNSITLDIINVTRSASITYTQFYVHGATIVIPKTMA